MQHLSNLSGVGREKHKELYALAVAKRNSSRSILMHVSKALNDAYHNRCFRHPFKWQLHIQEMRLATLAGLGTPAWYNGFAMLMKPKKCEIALFPLVLTANKEAIQVLVGENSYFGG